jgi:hypothetical protein
VPLTSSFSISIFNKSRKITQISHTQLRPVLFMVWLGFLRRVSTRCVSFAHYLRTHFSVPVFAIRRASQSCRTELYRAMLRYITKKHSDIPSPSVPQMARRMAPGFLYSKDYLHQPYIVPLYTQSNENQSYGIFLSGKSFTCHPICPPIYF